MYHPMSYTMERIYADPLPNEKKMANFVRQYSFIRFLYAFQVSVSFIIVKNFYD